MEASFFQKRFVIVAGKGGVGKSTLCAALGLAAARRGKRTIIAELNTREKAPLFFGKAPGGYTPQLIAKNLYSINISPEPALREYGLMKLRFEKIFEMIFENEAMKRLLRMIPGMNELLLLGKAFNLERERDRAGRPVWDMIIVDAPATGHGVSLLRLPQVILEVITSGPMADETRLMQDLLTDPRRTVMNIVTLPEEMPVRETLDLQHQIDTVLGIPKGYLFVNRVWPSIANDRERELLATLRDETPRNAALVHGALDCASSMAERRALQEFYLDELRLRVKMPAVEIPYLFADEFGAEAITTVADHIIKEAERLAMSDARFA